MTKVVWPSPSSCHSSSSVRALLLVSMPDVCEEPWLTAEMKDFSFSSMETISTETLFCLVSASMPELLVECRDRRELPSLHGWSRSSSSLMYDSRYLFFSGSEKGEKYISSKTAWHSRIIILLIRVILTNALTYLGLTSTKMKGKKKIIFFNRVTTSLFSEDSPGFGV